MNSKNIILKIIAIAGTIALAMHFLNRLITFLATKDAITAPSFSEIYEWRFGDISYTKEGSGPSILLLHDLKSGHSSHEWNNIRQDLAETNTVYIIDALGCGCSDKPNIEYSNFLYTQLITDFIKDVIQEKTILISSGMATSVSINVALYDGSNIEKLLLINPASIDSLYKVSNIQNKLLYHLIKTPILGTFTYNMLHTKHSLMQREEAIHTVDTFYECSHIDGHKSKYLFASIIKTYLTTNISHGLKSVKKDIYIISTQDTIDTAEIYTSINPEIVTKTMDIWENYPHLTSPEATISTIQEILVES